MAEGTILKSNILLMDLMTDGESLKFFPDERYSLFESPPLRHLLNPRNSLSALNARENGAQFGRFARRNGTSVCPRRHIFGAFSFFLIALSLCNGTLSVPVLLSIPFKINHLGQALLDKV